MPESAFADLYHVSYPRLSAQISSYLGDAAEAEDVVQEAYLRTWQRWSEIEKYDDPVAYLRRVAWNLATSRWRRLTVAARHLRLAPPPASPREPQPDHVAMVAALRQLPDQQRRAIVLHHIADLSVDDVASELNAPRGTVLSWLHRGREKLSVLLTETEPWAAANTGNPVPPVGGVRKRLRQRRRTAALGLSIGLLATATAFVAFFPSGTIDPPVVDNITEVDWTHTAISLPESSGDCPSGRQVVRPEGNGMGHVPDPRDGKSGPLYLEGGNVKFGDLTGDGVPEAVLPVWCSVAGAEPAAQTRFGGRLLVVQMLADRSLRGLAFVGPPGAYYLSYAVAEGQITTQVQYESESTRTVDAPAHSRTYRWNGTSFVQTSGRTEPLVLLPAKSGVGSPVRLPEIRSNGNVLCPARVVSFSGETNHYPVWTGWADIDGDGNQEGVSQITCAGHDSVYLLVQGTEAFEAAAVLFANDGSFEILPDGARLDGNTLTLKLRHKATGAEETRTIPVTL